MPGPGWDSFHGTCLVEERRMGTPLDTDDQDGNFPSRNTLIDFFLGFASTLLQARASSAHKTYACNLLTNGRRRC